MQQPDPHAPRVAGFTLIELLVAMAISALLIAIAYPTFMQAVYKSRRADAAAGLTRVQQAMERWRSSNTAYTDSPTNLGFATDPITSPDGHYTIAITLGALATTYQVTATAVGNQAGDTKCKILTVALSSGGIAYSSSDGVTTVTSANNPCWTRS